MQITKDVPEDFQQPVFQFLAKNKLWDSSRFHEWHLQEYQARRIQAAKGLGVLPSAWIIVSGRGDQLQHGSVVEFKVEYTERNAQTLDEYINELPSDLREEAKETGLIP